MTHEQFITLETARLAKQAGFDWEVYCNYVGDDHKLCRLSVPFNTNVSKSNLFSAPTQAVLQRWLREVKGIAVFVVPAKHNGEFMWFNSGYKVDDESATEILFDNNFFTTYEAALEAGLQKCLTLLIENKL